MQMKYKSPRLFFFINLNLRSINRAVQYLPSIRSVRGRAVKVINDAIHGQFRIDGVREELLKTPEMNKLSHIKQLGLAHLVFPGAHHTRFEHSSGGISYRRFNVRFNVSRST